MEEQVYDDQMMIAVILSKSLEDIFTAMKEIVEEKGDKENEWRFNYNDVTFTLHVELKGD